MEAFFQALPRFFGSARKQQQQQQQESGYTPVPTNDAGAGTLDSDIGTIATAVEELAKREEDKKAKARQYYLSFIAHRRNRMKDLAIQDFQYYQKLEAEASKMHKILIQLDTIFEALQEQETSQMAVKALQQGNRLLTKMLKETKAMDVEKTKEELEDLLEDAREETSELARPLDMMSSGMLPVDNQAMEKEFAAYEGANEGPDESFAPAVEAVKKEKKAKSSAAAAASSSSNVLSAESLVEIPL